MARGKGGGDVPRYIKMAARAAFFRLSTDSFRRSSTDGPTGARTGGELSGAHWDQRAQDVRHREARASFVPALVGERTAHWNLTRFHRCCSWSEARDISVVVVQ